MIRSTGIYIGFDFIDLVVLDSSGQRPKFVKSVRVPIYDEAVPSENRDKMAFVTPAIKKAFDIAALKIKNINFGIPQDEIIVRRFSMPLIPPDERLAAVRFEAQRYLPFKLDETISTFYVASESRTGKTMDAVFVAINKQAIGKYANLFGDLKISVNILDVIPVALLRIMGKSNILPADKTRVVIYLEKDMRGSVIIVKERDVYLVREIGASASKDTFLNSILNNLRLSIDYFKRETKEVEVSDIIICTDSKVSELESFLKENITSAKIETFNITDEIEGISELGKKQTIATGLAMGSFEKQGPKVNLSDQMPGRVVNFGFNEYKPLAIEGVAVILLLALINIIGNVSLTSANKKVNEIKTQKASMVKGVGSESTGEELLNLESKLIAQFNFLGNIVGEKKVLLTNKLNILSAIMPEGAWVESLNFKDEIDKERSCAVIGVIYSQGKNETEIANKIVADMKASREFSSGFNDIKLESVGRTIAYDKDVLSFTILCSGPAVSSAGVLEEGPR